MLKSHSKICISHLDVSNSSPVVDSRCSQVCAAYSNLSIMLCQLFAYYLESSTNVAIFFD